MVENCYMSNKSSLENLSLKEFQESIYRNLRPDIASFVDIILVKTYDDFLKVLYSNIDQCIKIMEEDPAVRQGNTEDRLTEDLKIHLRAKGYDVAHDEKIGGHCDLVVCQTVDQEKYMWLGEAKIHNSYDYLKRGFEQLCTRYLRGTPYRNAGGLLIYIYAKKAAQIIEEWRKRLKQYELENYSEQDCNSRPNLAFYSTHCHESSGLPVTIRHIGVVLHFEPQDK